jgi:hypothetical protein
MIARPVSLTSGVPNSTKPKWPITRQSTNLMGAKNCDQFESISQTHRGKHKDLIEPTSSTSPFWTSIGSVKSSLLTRPSSLKAVGLTRRETTEVNSSSTGSGGRGHTFVSHICYLTSWLNSVRVRVSNRGDELNV